MEGTIARGYVYNRRKARRRLWLLAEYVALFVVCPIAYVLDLIPLPPIPALWLFSGACLAILLGTQDFDRTRLWNARRLRVRLLRAFLPFLFAAPLIVLLTAMVAPERLLVMIRERPWLWAGLMLAYPVLSVYPQGLVYRAFIFHRYRPIFRHRWARIVASAVAFSMVHVIFENWVAPAVTLLGGLLFAWTYARTRSGLVASVQHALFGCYSFTIGLGWFFYYAFATAG